MTCARLKICGINSDEDANYLLRMLQMAWELQIAYLQSIPWDDKNNGHRKWKVMDNETKGNPKQKIDRKSFKEIENFVMK
jgi:hypothetical protein